MIRSSFGFQRVIQNTGSKAGYWEDWHVCEEIRSCAWRIDSRNNCPVRWDSKCSGRQRNLQQPNKAFKRQKWGAQLIDCRSERPQILGDDLPANFLQRTDLSRVQYFVREKYAAGNVNTPILCRSNARLRGCGQHPLPESLEASRVI